MAKTALVVEDDSGIANLIKDALEVAGLQVTVEKDGEQALSSLKRRFPDVMITDLLLPSLPGFELLEKLRALPGGKAVPVIVMSGIYRSQRHKKLAKDTWGVVASIDKPFDIAALVDAVKNAAGLAPVAPIELVVRKESEPTKPTVSADVEKAIRGNLRQRRFPEVLAQAFRFKATGALLLRRGRIKKIVYVKDGMPVFVKSNMLSECLGRVLVREKMITEEECEKSVELMPRSEGKLQGQVLIEMSALSPHNLVFGLQLQLEQKLYDVFSWADGDYQFNSRVEFPSEGITLDVGLANLVYEGVRRKFTDAAVTELLERSIDLYLAPHAEPSLRLADFVVDDDERILLALVDGRRTARDVVDASGLPARVARQLVYTLIAVELAQASRRAATFSKPAEPQKPPPRPTSTAPPLLPKKMPEAPLRRPADPVLAALKDDVIESVDALRIRLTERARSLKRANHYEVLGLSRQAGVEEVGRAFGALTRELQPDRLHRRSVPADVRGLADQLLQQLGVAADVLGDERRRQDYAWRLGHPQRSTSTSTTELHRLLEAETRAHAGEVALDAGRYDDAVAAFEAAAALLPEEGELAASLAWSMYQRAQNDPRVQADVMQRLQRAIELAPRFDRGWLWLGRVLQRAGRPGEARTQFARAIGCNPDNREAVAELGALR